MFFVWLIIVLLLSFLEAVTVSVVSIWFIISGIVALILSFFVDNIFIQFAVFVLLGVILLITTRKLVTKVLKVKDVKTNFDRVIGMTGTVTEDIKKDAIGEVKVDGKRWSAISTQDISKGEIVKVLKIDSTKLIVERVK